MDADFDRAGGRAFRRRGVEESVVIAALLMARHLDDRVPIPAKIPNFVQPGKSARDQGVFDIAFGV